MVTMEPNHKMLAAVALLALAFTITLPAIDNGFSLDDYNWLARVSFRSSTVAFLLTPEPGQFVNFGARGMWLAAFTGFGLEPMPYHALLLLLHGAVVLLLWRMASETFDADVGLLAAALFSAQTAGAEAIFWFAASPHVLVSALVLAGTFGIVRYLATDSAKALTGGLIAVGAALLTKGTAFAVLPVAAGWTAICGSEPRRRRATAVFGLGLAAVAAIALNLAVWGGESYLVERGLYRFGVHMFSNTATSVGMVVLPWTGIAAELDLSDALASARVAAGVAGLVAGVAILIVGSGRLRWWTALAAFSLAPTLPFAMNPTSRYVYLPSAAASVLAAVVFRRAIRRRGLRLAMVAALGLAALIDMRLRDNHFEYRERLMRDMVAGITTALPAPPADGVVQMAGLPRLGLDPGIHLEAALQIAWRDPSIRLELVPDDQADRPGILRWRDGRIIAGTTESPSAD